MDTEERLKLEKRLTTLEVSFTMAQKTIGALILAVIASLAGHFVDIEVFGDPQVKEAREDQ